MTCEKQCPGSRTAQPVWKDLRIWIPGLVDWGNGFAQLLPGLLRAFLKSLSAQVPNHRSPKHPHFPTNRAGNQMDVVKEEKEGKSGSDLRGKRGL